jgi:hypothetical protein
MRLCAIYADMNYSISTKAVRQPGYPNIPGGN